MGEDGLASLILEQEVNDYYKLYLFIETRRYVFRTVATKMVISNPEKYGFFLTDDDLYSPLEFDCMDIQCNQKTHINVIARAANTHFKVIKDLNPEFRKSFIPEGFHSILIPKDTGNNFYARYEKYLDRWLAGNKELIYVVQKGDNLSSIADQFNIPLLSLYNWNRLTSNHIYPGNRIVIYPKKTESLGNR